jgi:vacuolar-type H+-ATPase subunit I/STV1
MNLLATILRLVAIVASLAAVFIYLTARSHFASQSEEIKYAKDIYQQSQKELHEAVSTIKENEALIANERIGLAENKQKIVRLESALNESQQEKELMLDSLRQEKRKLQNLSLELNKSRNLLLQSTRKSSDASIRQEIADLEAYIEILYAENLTLKDELRDARERLALLLSTKDAPEKSQLLDPNFRPETTRISTQAEVTSINRKNNIIVFSVASDFALEPGFELTVVQKNNVLGKIRIFKVTESYSVANLLENFKPQSLDAGSVITIIR